MKRLISMLLLFAAVMSASAAVFTDSLGREIELPDTIDGIAPSGNLAQLVLYSVAPEKITGWSSRLSGSAREYFTQDVVNLPVFGTFYGKKANLNKEALMAAAPDVVIDMGEIKGSKEAMIADLDKLQDDILIPVIFIEAYLENTPEVYRTVGKLLGEEEKCEKLAVFAEEAINMAAEARTKIEDPVTVYYSSSADGLQAIPEGNFHGEVIEKIGAENAVKATLGASAAEISLEELYMSDPDVILLTEQDAYDEVTTNPLWSPLSAVINNRVYLIPSEPYPFIDNPPATNRIIGIYWLGNLLYPELYPINIIEEMKEFYSLYYNHELTDEDAARILGL